MRERQRENEKKMTQQIEETPTMKRMRRNEYEK